MDGNGGSLTERGKAENRKSLSVLASPAVAASLCLSRSLLLSLLVREDENLLTGTLGFRRIHLVSPSHQLVFCSRGVRNKYSLCC